MAHADHVVIVDTTALNDDPWLVHPAIESLSSLVGHRWVDVVIPEVVVREMVKHHGKRLDDSPKTIRKLVHELHKPEVAARLLTVEDALTTAEYEVELRARIALLGFEVGDLPTDMSRLVDRVVHRRRPVKEIQREAAGLQDALVWETALRELEKGPKKLSLVTSDNGFRAHEKLTPHRDLIADKEALGVDTFISTTKKLKDLMDELETLTAVALKLDEDGPLATARAWLGTPEAVDDVQSILDQQLVSVDLQQLDIDLFLEELPEVVDIQVETLTVYGARPDAEGVVAAVAIRGDITVEAVVHNSDWYMGRTSALSIAGKRNERYVEVEGELEVSVDATVVLAHDASVTRIEVNRVELFNPEDALLQELQSRLDEMRDFAAAYLDGGTYPLRGYSALSALESRVDRIDASEVQLHSVELEDVEDDGEGRFTAELTAHGTATVRWQVDTPTDHDRARHRDNVVDDPAGTGGLTGIEPHVPVELSVLMKVEEDGGLVDCTVGRALVRRS